MMKFIFVVGFMNFMLFYNNMIMFYYNLMYFISFMLIFIYMFKDLGVSLLVSMNFSAGYYSVLLIILSFWIVSLMLMCLNNSEIMKVVIFINLLMMLMLFFMSMDLMVFYLMFEVSLIPTFFLIVYWGGNPERLSASYYLMVYMLLVSFPLLIYIFNLYLHELTLKFDLLSLFMWSYEFSFGGYLVLYMAFFIKMPMYIMHIWLPKAHVEAPVYGSMILAGVLLKMGSYGLVRLLGMFIKSSFKYSFVIFSVSVVGSVLVSMVCMTQIDMKSLVAYSSVVHMNMMLCSFMTLFKLGFLSGYIMMVSHGLCSSGLFYMVNMYYSRTMSRLLLLNKGMMGKIPSLALWWFLLCVINFAFPFSLNFISEVLMLSVVLNWELFMMFYLVMICFFSSAYSLYLFSYIQHGLGAHSELSFNEGLLKELMVVILHVYPLILILLNLLMFM